MFERVAPELGKPEGNVRCKGRFGAPSLDDSHDATTLCRGGCLVLVGGDRGRQRNDLGVIKQIAKALDYDSDKLLAAGNAVGDDIEKIIRKIPTAVPAFLRTAKNLTEEEWISLTEQVKKMRKKK